METPIMVLAGYFTSIKRKGCSRYKKSAKGNHQSRHSDLRELSLLGATLLRGKGASLLGLLDLFDNSILQALGLGGASPARGHLSVSGDQELLEVPLDTLEAQQTRLLLLHESPDGRGVVTVHIEFSKYGERDTVVELTEGLDLIVGAGILAAELVAWETDDGEIFGVFGLQVLVELLETFELRGEAALRGGVHDQNDLARE